MVKETSCDAGDLGLTLGQEDPLEKEMATHSSILAGEFHGQGRTLRSETLAGRLTIRNYKWQPTPVFLLENPMDRGAS